MAIKDGLAAVDPIVVSFNKGGRIDVGVLGPYDAPVMDRANKELLKFEAPGHVGYDKDKNEIHIWFFGLMLCEYVAGLLEKKSRQGHCQNHRKPPTVPRCPPGGKLHREMLERFGAALNDLVIEINDKIKELKRDFPND
jgi:hypothetical protein